MHDGGSQLLPDVVLLLVPGVGLGLPVVPRGQVLRQVILPLFLHHAQQVREMVLCDFLLPEI